MLLISLLLIFYVRSAPENCVEYISENHCVQCSDGYYLQMVDNPTTGIPSLLCVQKGTIANCDAEDSGQCVRCQSGYYLKNNQCVGCTTGCNYCDENHCFQCGSVDGVQLYLSTDETQCVDCSKSINDEACGRCSSGTYFDTTTKSCAKCFDSCALCTEATNCFQCSEKLLEKHAGTAADPDKCVDIVHCSTGKNDDHCESCDAGYRLEGGNCVPCNSNCTLCYKKDDGKTQCTKCDEGFVLNKGECQTKDSLNCEVGSVTYGCLQCKTGYFFDSNLECAECSSDCGSCVSEASNCLSCSKDHYFKSGTTTCTMKDGNCSLVDQAGCKECANDLSGEGLKKTGYYVPPGKQECEECEKNCKLCEGDKTHCTACVTNYVLKKNGDHYECYNKSETCIATEMGYCTECEKGYFIEANENQDCIKCDPSCGTCKDKDNCLTCARDYYLPKNMSSVEMKGFCRPQSEINSVCQANVNGCEKCKEGFYINSKDPTQYNCTKCTDECKDCDWLSEDGTDVTKGHVICTSCPTEFGYVNDEGHCVPCSGLKNCATCDKDKCATCNDGYKMDPGSKSCSKTNWALIIPLVILGVIIIVIILVLLIAFVWWRRTKSVKAETAAIKPFHVSSDLELILLGADNEKFPLKTEKWELTFNLAKSKAVVDQEYTETFNLANMSKKEYYFEFHFTPSHKYDLDITPKSATLKPSTAVPITFKIKMLCTASVSDNIGISAMDIDDQNKETAKFTIVVESDLSLKLDHTELKPMMPPIGEGAFGMVFRGTYRGRDVAIKKMKARNLTQEQEKEFNHEVSMMTQLRHSCVVELIGAVYTEGEISIVTEFAEYGSLSKVWGKHPITYQLKVKILDDMAVALAYLHQNTIIHRDVKGENLLLFSLNPRSPVCAKLTDFGTCRNVSERNLASKALSQGIGTPTYMPPECLQNSSEYSYPVDVYAYGMVLYETYTEKNAYENDERFNQPWMIPQFVIEGNRLDKPSGVPENYWDLTTKCWSQNPEDRPTFAEVLTKIEGWGEDIKYALKNDGDKHVEESDVSSSSTPSSQSKDMSKGQSKQHENVPTEADGVDKSISSKSSSDDKH
ncbi:hypothetical protein EIN_053390 [Entamoeba invadens IP1]|uniref:hypothetical protein n=1 Tax=Entamoeba invadens IP1 TaxID=370355 RepID=UPI0002C3D705|nr:hypothetical protein EIN_053390 [Entamoeba invadens IP1]ELP93094.1 hypothetical protein EIN_053390 [Entamoeba invadens IP1]|eukprot:XP_004259865.1 hypothetical protein EIN_053390 [Entamoeba invadens IP1]